MEDEDPLVSRCRERVGQMVNGKYRLDALIGVGGMAAVYMATHRNGAVSAIKLLHDEVARNEEVRQRFLREAYIANKVGHEGTVKVLDDDIDELGAPFLVMELLQGKPIDALADASGGQLTIAETLDILDQTLAVLESAHAAKIVHRDLKPENLFMTGEGKVKVLDFGIARLREENARKTQTGMVMGTPSFMAPEQAMGRWDDVDARTDLYAMGATAFTLLSGHPVHEAETAGEMLVAAATRPARSLARVLNNAPFNLVAMIDKALAYERDQRFPDAATFRAALKELCSSLEADDVRLEAPVKADQKLMPGTVANADFEPGLAQRLADYDERQEIFENFDPSQNTDEETESMADVFTLFERALVATKQYGNDHPETARRFNETFRHLASALMTCNGCLAWNLTPYGFVVGERLIWEPEVPWNRIPYQLFSDGVRAMGFVPGVDEDEFQRWIKIVTLDPIHDLAPEDDMVTCLWDADFDSCFHQAIDTFAEGNQEDRARYEAHRNDIIHNAQDQDDAAVAASWKEQKQSTPREPEAAAQSSQQVVNFLARGERVDQGTAARVQNLNRVDPTDIEHADAVAALEMDATTKALLAARLEPDVGSTSERFVYCAAQAFIVAAKTGRSELVSTPLKRSVDGLGVDSPDKAMQMILALREAVEVEGKALETENLRDRLTTEIMSADTLGAILFGSLSLEGDELEDYSDQMRQVLGCLQAEHFDSVAEFLPQAPAGELRSVLIAYLERTGRGQEDKLAMMFAEADVDLGLALVRILSGIDTPEAREAISAATGSPHPLVRIEALGHLEGVSGLRVKAELRNLMADPDGTVRVAALRTMERHGIAAAGPFLVVRIQEKEFLKLPLEERRQSLKTLRALKVQRCEEVCVTLLAESSWLRGEGLESTRELAAHFLGEIATTNDAFYALEHISKRRDFRNTKAVKAAAEAALTRITERAEAALASKKKRARKKRGTRSAVSRRSTGNSTGAPKAVNHSEARPKAASGTRRAAAPGDEP